MIEGFIVIIVSILLWGKVSKDTLETKPKLDIVRTIVYFTLTLIVAIIYYKSSQVGISTNRIEIKKLVGTTNQFGVSLDSVSVGVNYRMTPNNVEYTTTYKNYRPLGGVDFLFNSKFSYSNLSIDTTRLRYIYKFLYECLDNPKINNSFSEKSCLGGIIKRYKEELYQYRPNLGSIQYKLLSQPQNTITGEDSVELMNALHYIFQDQRSLLFIGYCPPKRKTFLPIDLYKKNVIQYVKRDDENNSYFIKERAFLDKFVDSLWLRNGVNEEDQRLYFDSHNVTTYNCFVGSKNAQKMIVENRNDTLNSFRTTISDSLLNYVDYFTASDMSQRIFKVILVSEIPLTGLAINFDEPINISAIDPTPDIIGMNQVVYMDRKKLDFLRDKSLMFHAKLPTFENKQLLRSLVLTTILTAVFSLFCTNLYLCGRGFVRRYLTQRIISDKYKEKYRRRLSIYQYSVIASVVIVSAVPIWLYIKYLYNDPLLLKTENAVYIFGFSILFLGIVFVGFKIWKHTYLNGKENNNK